MLLDDEEVRIPPHQPLPEVLAEFSIPE